MLAVTDLGVAYGGTVTALRDVTLEVGAGEVVALLGANGAGKTTLLRAVSGLLGFHHATVTSGRIDLDGEPVDPTRADRMVRRGLAQVMEGRRIFAELSVEENLRAGAFTRRDRTGVRDSYEHVLSLFPVLAQRSRSAAGLLSGGEQQMLAIGRALMANPRILLLDEPSLGLAPLIVTQIRDIIAALHRDGMTVLLVEQNATMALSLADRGYVLESGRVAKEGTAEALLADADIREFYLGIGESGRTSHLRRHRTGSGAGAGATRPGAPA